MLKMDNKDYEIILNAIEKVEQTEEVKKFKRKIELFLESEKVRNEYQETMEKISKEIQEIMSKND